MAAVTKAGSAGLLFLLAIVTGLWLSRTGRPGNNVILGVHKLIALASVVLALAALRRDMAAADIGSVTLLLLVASGIFVLSLFITGALLSTGKPQNALILTIHRVAPLLTVITTGLAAITSKQ